MLTCLCAATRLQANLILEAVTQVIRSTRGDELTPTAYYGALMASMESQGSKLAADGDAIPVRFGRRPCTWWRD